MQKIVLGRTNLSVSAAGLGCGGFSRLGLPKFGEDHAAGIVRAAFDEGVDFFDTAEAYGTEPAVGKGLTGISRDQYVLSSKFSYKEKDGSIIQPEVFEKKLENALHLLKTEYVDIYHIHALAAADYPEVREKLFPAMKKAQKQGKIRFPGMTEMFGTDTSHEMMKTVLPDNSFDVVMVGYNLLNPSAVKSVFPVTKANNVGTLCMFAVRTALSNPEMLEKCIAQILEKGQADPKLLNKDEKLAFLTENGAAGSIMEAAYRFCRHTDGINVVLTGTGNKEHLKANIKSIQMPPLPKNILDQLDQIFGQVDCVSGQ